MKLEREKLKVYAVTDRSWLESGETIVDPVEELLQAGVRCIQLRDKEAAMEELEKEAIALKKLCKQWGAYLIINDYPELAKKVGADGVHVGLSDMGIEKARAYLGPDYIIGGSAHNVKEALQAEAAGADYIGCGAVFGSATKTDAGKLELDELKAICKEVRIPVVAIGGIQEDNVRQLAGSGMTGVAVISALFAAEDKKRAVSVFMEEVK